MLTATGLVMALKDDTYTNKDGVSVPQLTIAVFDESGDGELLPILITYGKDYAANVSHMRALHDLKGKRVVAGCNIMSFKNGGYKLLAVGLPKVISEKNS